MIVTIIGIPCHTLWKATMNAPSGKCTNPFRKLPTSPFSRSMMKNCTQTRGCKRCERPKTRKLMRDELFD